MSQSHSRRDLSRRRHTMRSGQSGAALIVGLVMLSIVTLLAITAMNTSSTELIMAGNEQFRERAFQAAEAGVERATRDLAKVPQDRVVKPGSGASTEQPEDTYKIESVYVGADADIPGYGTGFAGYHYTVTSTGISRRNSRSVHQQGAYVVGNADPGYTEWLPGADAP